MLPEKNCVTSVTLLLHAEMQGRHLILEKMQADFAFCLYYLHSSCA